jgi:hypothetical protein
MNYFEYRAFFDESTRRNNLPDQPDLSLTGSLLIPLYYYKSDKFSDYNSKLRKGECSFHFTNYSRRHEEAYSRLLKTLLGDEGQYIHFLKLNILAFSDNGYLSNIPAYNRRNSQRLTHMKLPERVLYGALRDVSRFKPTRVNLYIEDSSEYTHLKLNTVLKNRLNEQAIYRNDSFFVRESYLIPKGKQIGVELTDLLIGIIGLIIQNDSLNNCGEPGKDKQEFIFEHKDILEKMIKEVNYYELHGNTGGLTRRNLLQFFNEFILRYCSEKRITI